MDIRIQSLGTTPFERFVLACLEKAVSPADLEAIIAEQLPKGEKHRQIVAGQPFIHWRGKTVQDLVSAVERGEITEEQMDEIIQAHEDRDLTLDTGNPPSIETTPAPKKKAGSGREYGGDKTPPKNPEDGKGSTGSTEPSTGEGSQTKEEGEGDDGDKGEAVEEPTFAGHKLSDLAGKTDEELLAIPHIGPATVDHIRKAEKAAKKSAK